MKRVLVFLFAMAPAVTMATAVDSLNRFFRDSKTYEARFEQAVLDEALNVIQETSGTLRIHRPDRFRWEYDPPYRQTIVGDGQKVWVYDIDLEQITARKMSKALGDTPAVLLAGKGDLDKNFTVTDLGEQGKLNWVQMVPKNRDGGYEDIRIGFEGDTIRTLELIDGLGHTTRIKLSKAKVNPNLGDEVFTFVPPKGIDVIDETTR